jgi:IclR family transcriptional regulator, acetate operon repressor
MDDHASDRAVRPGAIRSVANALRVIEAFHGREPLGVTELAKRVSLPKATVQRVLSTLYSEGWIRESPTPPTRWVPAQKLLIFASRLYREDTLRQAATPVMQALRDKTQESVTLSIRQGASLVLVDRADSQLPLRIYNEIGTILPIHATSSGKAILAEMPPAEVTSLLVEPLARFTDRTFVDHQALFDELAAIAERGFSVNWGEWSHEIVGIGAAITDVAGVPIAGTALAVPTVRCTHDRAEALGPEVARAAQQIGENLRSSGGSA